MWKWIAEQWDDGDDDQDVNKLKETWLDEHGSQPIEDDCFFCDYGLNNGKEDRPCESCPGYLVDPGFNCENPKYHYRHRPIKFYEKIIALNKKRESDND
jgi:hypothetical protein